MGAAVQSAVNLFIFSLTVTGYVITNASHITGTDRIWNRHF